ncbi:MAG: hypothetical protein ABI637_04355 [Gemmatimonadota bacterium]
MRAYRAGDLKQAQQLGAEAHAVWPPQPYYAYGLASLAARAGDTSTVLRALDAYAAMGLGADLATDDDFAAIRGAPALSAISGRLRANMAPMARSHVAFRLAEPDFFPEGIACDARTGACYVASIRYRKVVRVLPDGSSADFVGSAAHGLLGAMAVGIGAGGPTLWVSSVALPQMLDYGGSAADSAGGAALHEFDLRTGALVRQFAFPGDSIPANPGDMYVARSGEVFVSDSRRGVVYRVLPMRAGVATAETVTIFARDPLLRSPQGIAESEDGSLLYVADYSHGILAIDRATHAVRPVAAPPGSTTLGIDGLVRVGGALIGVQNGVQPPRIVRMSLGRNPLVLDKFELIDRNLPLANGPTSGAMLNGEYRYVANSLWDFYDDEGRRKAGAVPEAPVILGITWACRPQASRTTSSRQRFVAPSRTAC